MEVKQLCEEQAENVVNVTFQVLFHNPRGHRYLEEKLRNMKVGGKLRVFGFNDPYFLRSFDKEINQILDSEEHANRKYNKNTNEQNLTYKIWRVK